MTDQPEQLTGDDAFPDSEEPREEPDGQQANTLQELRDLLAGPLEAQLDELQGRLDDNDVRAEELSGVLAEAIRIRAGRDEALA